MRSLGAVLLVVLVLLAGTATALWWFPAPLLGAALRLGGLEAVRFEGVRLSPGSLEIDGLQIGAPPEHRLARLLIGYRLGDLLRGRVARLEIVGLELHGRLVDGRIELAGLPSTPGGGEAAPLPWPEQIVLQDALIRLETPWGELRAPLAAEAMLDGSAASFRLEMTGGELINDAGRLQADLGMTGSAPLARSPTLGDLSAQGRLEVAAEHFALPELAGGIDGKAAAAFKLAAGRLEARLESGALRVAELAPALAPLRTPLPPPWRIELADAARPVRLSGALAGDRIELDLDGALRLAAGAATVGLDLAARLAGDDRGRLTGLGGRARVELSALRWPMAALEQGSLEIAGDGAPDAWQGTLDLTLAGSAQSSPEIALRGAVLRHRLGLSLSGKQLVVSAREDGALALERLVWQGKGQAGLLAFALPPQQDPLLAATFGAGGGVSWQQRLRATAQGFDFTAQTGPTPLRGRAELGELALALDGDQDGLRGGRLTLAGGRLRLPEAQLTLAGIASEVALAKDELAPGQTIPLTVETISQDATPAWFAPLSLRGALRPDPAALDFEARLSGPAGALALTLRGRHTIASGRGRAEVELAPLTFFPGGLQPRALAPASAAVLSEVAGTVGLHGSIGWGGGAEIAADLALLLEEAAFTSGPARFSRVNGVVALDRLWPPSTPPGQQLAIGLVDLGLPLTRGTVAFQLLPEGALAVERLGWDFAGGTVGAAPFRVGSAASAMLVTLNAERLDLAQLFALTRLDGLSGEGTISGTLPLRISGAEAVIEGGELSALGPGWLRYRSDGVPAALQAGGENVSLLLQALENFRYEALRITLDGRTDAEMDIGLHVKGANPDLYDGYPIDFNLNLEGELANILRSGLASYQIPERIRERMQGFRR